MPEQEIIAARAFEKVIDAGYKDLPIFSRPTEVAFYGVLAAYDSHLVTQKIVRERRDWEPLSVGQTQFFKSLAEGLVWAVRSLLETQQPSEAHPVASSQVVSEANELLMYGAKYFIVGMMYSRFSRGEASAAVEMPARCIRFVYSPEYRRSGGGWGYHDDVINDRSRTKTRKNKRPSPCGAAALRSVRQLPYHFEDGRIVLDDPRRGSCGNSSRDLPGRYSS